MRKYVWIVVLFLTGCLYNDTLETSSLAENNLYRLRQLCIGMSEEEVFVRMRAPVKEEQVVIGNDQYDIWFYITRRTCLDQEYLVRRNSTPIIFKNERLIGMGYALYDRIIYVASTPEKPTPPTQKSDSKEDQNLEKSLNRKASEPAKSPLPQSSSPPKQQTPPVAPTSSSHSSEHSLLTPPSSPSKKSSPKQKEGDSQEEEPYFNEEEERMLRQEREEDFNEN